MSELSETIGAQLAAAGNEYSNISAEVSDNYSRAYSNVVKAYSADSSMPLADLQAIATNLGISATDIAKFDDSSKTGLINMIQQVASEGMKRATQVMEMLSNLLEVIFRTKQKLVDSIRV